MVARGLVPSRARARDMIQRGFVSVDGQACLKVSTGVAATQRVVLDHHAPSYVSRGAEKLVAALDAFGFSATGRIALDVGASTGGFTQVLIERGAGLVYAIDVGRGQLRAALTGDPHVITLEGIDARDLDPLIVPDAIEAIVADVSFISVTKALPAALALAAPGAWLVALIKPQFEAGRKYVGRGGIVRDPVVQQQAVRFVETWIDARSGWSVKGIVPSPILGGSGNAEFLIGATFSG